MPGVSEPLLLVDHLGSMGAFVDRLSGCSYRSEAAVSGGGRLATAVDESQEPFGVWPPAPAFAQDRSPASVLLMARSRAAQWPASWTRFQAGAVLTTLANPGTPKPFTARGGVADNADTLAIPDEAVASRAPARGCCWSSATAVPRDRCGPFAWLPKQANRGFAVVSA